MAGGSRILRYLPTLSAILGEVSKELEICDKYGLNKSCKNAYTVPNTRGVLLLQVRQDRKSKAPIQALYIQQLKAISCFINPPRHGFVFVYFQCYQDKDVRSRRMGPCKSTGSKQACVISCF